MVIPSIFVIAVDNTTHLVQFNPSSQLPIKLLGPSNFVIWKAQVESLMLGHDLYGYLDGTMTAPSKNVLENASESTKPSPLQSQTLPPPRKRGTHYITCMPTNHIHDITAYLQEIRNVADELATTGALIQDDELDVKILSGLGPEYDSISAAIQARNAPISYEELYNKLLNRELFLQHKEPH
ncbi:hypothetical protein KY284_033143 [Solanum tuberosum]|nr:hypothetical protein KY284_033143 [Solanum tuberosum]